MVYGLWGHGLTDHRSQTIDFFEKYGFSMVYGLWAILFLFRKKSTFVRISMVHRYSSQIAKTLYSNSYRVILKIRSKVQAKWPLWSSVLDSTISST